MAAGAGGGSGRLHHTDAGGLLLRQQLLPCNSSRGRTCGVRAVTGLVPLLRITSSGKRMAGDAARCYHIT
jgi:hypothetical protein